ncbi:PhoD-like phosphatase [Leptolyngbya sp. PCC 7375]|nr:PhoD-like phosphatase [Leptolyngbya sp. PCC 7375]
MSWQTSWQETHGLSNRIGAVDSQENPVIPLILCGPMLRRVESDAVSVFVALKHPRKVKLTIYEGTGSSGQVKFESVHVETVPLGNFLHVVVVTAQLPQFPNRDEALLKSGVVYGYDLTLIKEREGLDDFTETHTLGSLGLLEGDHALGYKANQLPSFSVPPTDLNKLRLVHGSCRNPYGEGLDAFEALDSMVEETHTDANKRPHQLFLTGDQIYADEVPDTLLAALMDAGDTLLGWQELAIDPSNTTPVTPKGVSNISIPSSELQPGRRSETTLERCGFTTKVHQSHLLSLGEYYAMYLFAWSPVLWPSTLPTFEEIYPGKAKTQNVTVISNKDVFIRKENTPLFSSFSKEVRHVKNFKKSLPKVRRALANIPTYMIFDDHEVTDDWYLNLNWCRRVLKQPLGRHVIQNGLSAYGIFQAWGNTPHQFVSGQPGRALLDAAVAWSKSQGTDTDARQQMSRRVGVPNNLLTQVNARRGLSHNANALEWHYSLVVGSAYEVIVLDTRTWRAFPGKADFDFPAILSDEGFQTQILSLGTSQTEVTLVVSPGVVFGLPPIYEEHKGDKSLKPKERFDNDSEDWIFQTPTFERLFSALAQRAQSFNNNGNSKRQGRVVFLSGDVHYGLAARLQYWASRPFNSASTGEAELVVAQLTSSAFKNETRIDTSKGPIEGRKGTEALHNHGFSPLEVRDSLPDPRRHFGWENPDRKRQVIGRLQIKGGGDFGDKIPIETDLTVKDNPAMLALEIFHPNFSPKSITSPPDWRYRIDYIMDTSGERQPAQFNPHQVTGPPPGDRRQALSSYLAGAANHQDYNRRWGDGKEIVGLNNVGEVTFKWGDTEKTVTQHLWWRLRSKRSQPLPPFPLTQGVVSLEFNDLNYPEPTV